MLQLCLYNTTDSTIPFILTITKTRFKINFDHDVLTNDAE